MKKTTLLASLIACVTIAHAELFEFHVTMTGSTGARGEDLNQRYSGDFPPITLDTSDNSLRLPIGWGSGNVGAGTDLSSPFIDAVLYKTSGGAMDLYTVASSSSPGSYNDQGGGGATGSFDNTITLDTAGSRSAYPVTQQQSDLENGLWFMRIDSQNFPNGEISGQLTPVPEPEQYAAVFAFALLGFAGYRRFKVRPATA